MRRLFLLCGLVPLTAVASEHWTRFTSGPIEVFSSAGSKDGRDTLVKFEEFRHALGQGCVFFVLVATDTSTLRDFARCVVLLHVAPKIIEDTNEVAIKIGGHKLA
jgi:hypothetical protein